MHPFWEIIVDMANHKSALKRIRSNEAKRLRNRYYHKTMRNAVRALRESNDKKEATEMLWVKSQPRLMKDGPLS